MRRAVSFVLLALAVGLLAGCQTDAYLEVQVDVDGGGAVYVAVALDQEAAARSVLYEGTPPNALPVQDLIDAGWTVTGPTQEQDGRIWLRAEKEFSQLDQLGAVINEVAGPNGPFRNFEVQRSSSFGERQWQFSGTVDLSGGLAAFSDEGIAAAFGGAPLGQPEEIITQQLGMSLEEAVKFSVVVDLPGDLKEHNGVVGSAGLAVPTTTTTTATTTTATTAAGAEVATTGEAAPTTLAPRTPGRGAAFVWTPSFADQAPASMTATSSSRRLLPRLWRWAALVAVVVGAVALLYRLGQTVLDHRRDRRRSVSPRAGGRVRARTDDPQPVPVGRFGDAGATDPPPMVVSSSPSPAALPGQVSAGAGPGPPGGAVGAAVGEDDAGSAAGNGRSLSLIIIETTGALLAGRDPVGDALVPFCRERGCVLSIRQIADQYLARTVGGLSPSEFWRDLGLSGDPMLLDDTFARRFELTDHVVAFLSQARNRGVMVAALGDDVPEWTGVFRQRFRLDGLIGTWVSSAEVGVRVPHPALLDAVLEATGARPAQSMVIASSRTLLDAAGRMGYRTVHYNPGPDDPDSDHPVLRTFAERGQAAPSPASSG